MRILKEYRFIKNKLLEMGFKVEYNIMKKSYDQDVMLILDFSDRSVGVCRVEMKSCYFEIEKFQELSGKLETEIIKLRLEGILE